MRSIFDGRKKVLMLRSPGTGVSKHAQRQSSTGLPA
jgi:hypothetical protein